MSKLTILFDLDGTLIDSAPDVCRALNRTLESYHRRSHSVEEVKNYLGHGARIMMEMALKNTGPVPPNSKLEELTTSFLKDYADNPVVKSKVFPGVIGALSELKTRGALLAICTNKPKVTAEPVLEHLSLLQYFDAVICPDKIKNRKPHGDHIKSTIDAVGGNINYAIMVGDSENDIDAAIDAGIPSIAVTFGYAINDCETLGATALIDHFDKLIATIEEIFTTDCMFQRKVPHNPLL